MRDADVYGEEPVYVRDMTEEATENGLNYRVPAFFYRLMDLDTVEPLYFARKDTVLEVNVSDTESLDPKHGCGYVIVTSSGEIWGEGYNPSGRGVVGDDGWQPFSTVEAAVDGTVQELVDDFFDGEPPYEIPDAEELLSQ